MKYSDKTEEFNRLYDALLSIETRDECREFLEDICTINELKALAQRLDVAFMLKDEMTYSDIAKKTGASTATISRVNRCLNYGSDGYNKVISRMNGYKN